MRRAVAILAAAVLVAALVAASDGPCLQVIQKGISDDAQILYGNPDKVFPLLSASSTPSSSGSTSGGAARNGVATHGR